MRHATLRQGESVGASQATLVCEGARVHDAGQCMLRDSMMAMNSWHNIVVRIFLFCVHDILDRCLGEGKPTNRQRQSLVEQRESFAFMLWCCNMMNSDALMWEWCGLVDVFLPLYFSSCAQSISFILSFQSFEGLKPCLFQKPWW